MPSIRKTTLKQQTTLLKNPLESDASCRPQDSNPSTSVKNLAREDSLRKIDFSFATKLTTVRDLDDGKYQLPSVQAFHLCPYPFA